MDKDARDFINEYIASLPWLTIIESVNDTLVEDNYVGKIVIQSFKGDVEIMITIPQDFPLKGIQFMCIGITGYPHLMPNGLLCLNVAPAGNLAGELQEHFSKLRTWMMDYYESGKQDAHFEYYIFDADPKITFVFEEDGQKTRPAHCCGRFSYTSLRQQEISDERVWLVTGIGDTPSRFSATFMSFHQPTYEGLYFLLSRPPMINVNQGLTEYEDLLLLLTEEQKGYFFSTAASISIRSGYQTGCIVIVGYEIPSLQSGLQELRWEPFFISLQEYPLKRDPITDEIIVRPSSVSRIHWCKGINASYERMFGRGRLCSELTSSKILVMGVGAVGSQLAHSLVRGGCRYIDISDSDKIEPGNICRSAYTFVKTDIPKVQELFNQLVGISPHLEMQFNIAIEPILDSNKGYEKLKMYFSKYDFIFDCTTNKHLSIMLDGMQLPGRIINLSISNMARHMVVITGVSQIHVLKNRIYNKISPDKREPFYPETGCWSPTFEASNSDIAAPLHYVINELNYRLEKQLIIASFMIVREEMNHSLAYELTYDL
ncbi:ThiF family protein [Chitinophaga sp. CF118]|uniref:ThiF family adenylyltransferase n=1 Tax=Chitinophaga sp. CF118 TaxID=1884367 RepID=UPI0008DEE7DC|nr:ThiF family adenylyltransferase [Chitinophaga sp. CF118]SFE39970.1 ThiF family protein [Chitinophaga sp. CF118]